MKLYAQTIFADAASNLLGLVFSNGVELLIDPRPGTPTNSMASAAPMATSESGAIRWGGPVIQLTGAGFN